MIDPTKVRSDLTVTFIRLAQQAASAGCAIGSTSEQIVGALLNKRADWLPSAYPTPLEAIIRLDQGGEDWWHTLLYVYKRGWSMPMEMHEDRLC